MGTMLHKSITGETAHLFQTPGQSGLEAILISAIPACYKLNCNQLEAGGKLGNGMNMMLWVMMMMPMVCVAAGLRGDRC